MRALGLRPVLPVLHRRGVLPACVPARTLRPEPLEEAPRRQARTSAHRGVDRDPLEVVRRNIGGKADLEAVFEWPLTRANQIRSQQQRQRGWKLYSFHAPEVECIGKGKASAPYEFGVKASIVTTNARAPGGQFVLHAK